MRFFHALNDIKSLEQKFIELYSERIVLRDSTNLNNKAANQVCLSIWWTNDFSGHTFAFFIADQR